MSATTGLPAVPKLDPEFGAFQTSARDWLDEHEEELRREYGDEGFKEAQRWAIERDQRDTEELIKLRDRMDELCRDPKIRPDALHYALKSVVGEATNERVKKALGSRHEEIMGGIWAFSQFHDTVRSMMGDPETLGAVLSSGKDVLKGYEDNEAQAIAQVLGFANDFPAFLAEYRRAIANNVHEYLDENQGPAKRTSTARAEAIGWQTQPGLALSLLAADPFLSVKIRRSFGQTFEYLGMPETKEILADHPQIEKRLKPGDDEALAQYQTAKGFYVDVASNRDEIAAKRAQSTNRPMPEVAQELQGVLEQWHESLGKMKAELPSTEVDLPTPALAAHGVPEVAGVQRGVYDPFALPPAPGEIPETWAERADRSLVRGALEYIAAGKRHTGAIKYPRANLPKTKYLLPANLEAVAELTGNLLASLPAVMLAGLTVGGGPAAALRPVPGMPFLQRAGMRALHGAATGGIYGVLLDPTVEPWDIKKKLATAPAHVVGFAAISAGLGAFGDFARWFAGKRGWTTVPKGTYVNTYRLRRNLEQIFKDSEQAGYGEAVAVLRPKSQQIAQLLADEGWSEPQIESLFRYLARKTPPRVRLGIGVPEAPAGPPRPAPGEAVPRLSAPPEVVRAPSPAPQAPTAGPVPAPPRPPGQKPEPVPEPRGPAGPPVPSAPGIQKKLEKLRDGFVAEGIDPIRPKTHKEAREVARRVGQALGWKASGTKNLILTNPNKPTERYRFRARRVDKWVPSAKSWLPISNPTSMAREFWNLLVKKAGEAPPAPKEAPAPPSPKPKPTAPPEKPSPEVEKPEVPEAPKPAPPPAEKPVEPPVMPPLTPKDTGARTAEGWFERKTPEGYTEVIPPMNYPMKDLRPLPRNKKYEPVLTGDFLRGNSRALQFLDRIMREDPSVKTAPMIYNISGTVTFGHKKVPLGVSAAEYTLFVQDLFRIQDAGLRKGERIHVQWDAIPKVLDEYKALKRQGDDALEAMMKVLSGAIGGAQPTNLITTGWTPTLADEVMELKHRLVQEDREHLEAYMQERQKTVDHYTAELRAQKGKFKKGFQEMPIFWDKETGEPTVRGPVKGESYGPFILAREVTGHYDVVDGVAGEVEQTGKLQILHIPTGHIVFGTENLPTLSAPSRKILMMRLAELGNWDRPFKEIVADPKILAGAQALKQDLFTPADKMPTGLPAPPEEPDAASVVAYADVSGGTPPVATPEQKEAWFNASKRFQVPDLWEGYVGVDPIYGAKPKSAWEITKRLQRLRSLRVYYRGRMPSAGTLGFYRWMGAEIALRFFGDIHTTGHETAHWTDRHLKLFHEWIGKRGGSPFDEELNQEIFSRTTHPSHPAWKRRSEQFAEWMVAWASNPREAQRLAPKLYAYFLETVPEDMMAVLQDFSRDIREWKGGTPMQKIDAHHEGFTPGTIGWSIKELSFDHTIPERFTVTPWDHVVAAVSNSSRVLEKSFDWLKAWHGMGMNLGDVDPRADPYARTRLFAGVNRKVRDVLENGMIDAWRNRVIPKGLHDWVSGPLDHANAEIFEKHLKDAGNLMIAERILERHKLKMEGGLRIDVDPRLSRISGVGIGLEDEVQIAKLAIAESKTWPKEYLQAAKECGKRYRHWGKCLLDYDLQTGRISQETYDLVRANNEYHVYFMRRMDIAPDEPVAYVERAGAGKKAPGRPTRLIFSFGGSGRPLKNVFESLEAATAKTIVECDRNLLIRSFINLIEGPEEVTKFTDPKPTAQIGRPSERGAPNTVPVWRDGGKLEYWQLQPDVYKALMAATTISADFGTLMKVFTLPPQMTRSGVIYSVPFQIRNLFRDVMHRVHVTKSDSKIIDSFRKYGPMEVSEFRLAGGDAAGHYVHDELQWIRGIATSMPLLAKAKNTVLFGSASHALNRWQELASTTELQGRMAEYAAAKKKWLKAGADEMAAQELAAVESRDLMDFFVAGYLTRILNRMIIFLNPAVRAIDVQGRNILGLGVARKRLMAEGRPATMWNLLEKTLTDSEANQLRKRGLIKWFLMSVLPISFEVAWNTMLGAEDERRKLQPYRRFCYWNFRLFNDWWLSIPKNFEVGVLGSGVDAFFQKADGEPYPWTGYGGALLEAFLPFDASALTGPFESELAVLFNKDAWRDFRPIIPEWQKEMSLESRMEMPTAREAIERQSRLAKLLQGGTGIDARAWEWYVGDRFGTIGRQILRLSDIGKKDGQPFHPLRDVLGLGFKESPSSSRDVAWIYDKAREEKWQGRADYRRLDAMMDDYYAAPDQKKKFYRDAIYDYAERVRAAWTHQLGME